MHLSRRMLLQSTAATAVALSASAFAAPAPLSAQFDALGEAILAANPEYATYLGLDSGPHAGLKARLADRSWAAVTQSHTLCSDTLKQLAAIPASQLTAADAQNRAVIAYALELDRDASAFTFGDNTLMTAMSESASPYVVSQQSGNFVGVPEMLDSQHRIDTKQDADAYLARVEAVAVTLDQETARVAHDVAAGVCPPDFLLRTATGQMTRFLATPAAQQRLVVSLIKRTAAKNIAGDYAASVTKLTADKVYPAIQRQLDGLNTALKTATADAGVWKIKDGEAYYSWLLKVGTTTPQTAAMRTSKAGRCMPSSSPTSSASTTAIRSASSAICRASSSAPCAWWSTPACTRCAGRATRRSTGRWSRAAARAPR
jgi:uncharacterized protein (DUF885 family)